MHASIEQQINDVIRSRKHLAEVESKYAARQETEMHHQPAGDLIDAIQRLEKAENRVRETCTLHQEQISKLREQIISLHNEYDSLHQQMSQIEDLFLVNIIRPGNNWRQAIRQREYLEKEYKRIQTAIAREKYGNQQELEADIQHALTHAEAIVKAAIDKSDEEFMEENNPVKRIEEISVDDVFNAISLEKLLHDFKHIVLPAVHPDTSDSPPETFNTAFNVYKKRDFLLMEAYLVKYRGEVKVESDLDVLIELDRILQTEEHYTQILLQLQDRYDRLEKDITTQELNDPAELQLRMQQQREEILEHIQEEAQKILYWREKLEGLL